MQVQGINIGYGDTGFIQSKSRTRVWADEVCEAVKWGLFFRLSFGRWLRPVRKFWTKDNPWTSGNHWFVLDSHIRLPGLFFSVFYKGRYFYVGTKTYGVNSPDYSGWLDPESIKDGNLALAPSASIRGVA